MRTYAIIAVILAVLGFFTYILQSKAKLEKELLECKVNSEKLISAIELQNAEIQRQALETEKYKARQSELENKVNAKYNAVNYVSVKDSTCEQNLQNINEVLILFYKGATR